MNAESMAEMGGVPLEAMLEWHLTSNHYPPINPAMVPFAVKAIEMARAEEWDGIVTITLGEDHEATLKGEEGREATCSDLMESWHLDSFMEVEV